MAYRQEITSQLFERPKMMLRVHSVPTLSGPAQTHTTRKNLTSTTGTG